MALVGLILIVLGATVARAYAGLLVALGLVLILADFLG